MPPSERSAAAPAVARPARSRPAVSEPAAELEVAELAAAIRRAIEDAGDPTRAERERAYLKSDRRFVGCGVPAARRIVRTQLGEIGWPRSARHDDVAELAAELWDGPFFECRRAAVEVLERCVATLGVDDLSWIERWIRDGETWAIVDELATHVVGPVFAADRSAAGGVLDRWAVDPDSFWVRRAAMLALLVPLRTSDEDWDRFCGYAVPLLGEREFFIRKAIGWILRDVSRRWPDPVRGFVAEHRERMSGVTLREATKYLA